MTHYKVVVSDLDGTLLNAEHTLSDYSKKVFKTLHDQGVYMMIATGRHHIDTQKIKEKLGIEGYTITSNGATVADESGKLIYEASIDKDALKGILAIPVSDQIIRNLYQGEDWVIEREDLNFKEYYREGGFHHTIAPFEKRLDHDTNKIFYTSYDHELLKALAEKIMAKFADKVVYTFSLPQCLEIMPIGINKGKAIEKVLTTRGLSVDDAVAFGDGFNDIEMLQTVGKGYVMGNAHAGVKETLPDNEVIGIHSEDAVAKKLVEIFELKI